MTSLKERTTIPSRQFLKSECKNKLLGFRRQLFELQNVFYADGRYGLLIILQGMDTSGKDGVIRHVMASMNPMGVHVESFKKPTEEEQKHDFMWRIYPHVPARGMIQVLNRSYYEDIIVPSVNDTMSGSTIAHRYTLINELEQHFTLNNIHVLKFFLHISKDEQQKRIKERLTKPHKRWKYSIEDTLSAEKWDGYLKVYDSIISQCCASPWHIIPSDKRWYRNYLVAKILKEHFEKLELKYPTFK